MIHKFLRLQKLVIKKNHLLNHLEKKYKELLIINPPIIYKDNNISHFKILKNN
jgi:hypothetical protein